MQMSGQRIKFVQLFVVK